MNYSELIERYRQYQGILKKRKRLIFVLATFMGGVFAVRAFFIKPTYKAKTIFHPVATSESGFGSISNPFSLFSGTPEPGMESLQMIGVLKSRTISEAVVRDSVGYQGKKQLLADLILAKNPSKFSLTSWITSQFRPASVPSYNNKIIKAGAIIRRNAKIENNLEGFIEFNYSNTSMFLTQRVSEKFIEQLSEYYKNQKTEKAQNNLDFFTYRSDSIYKEFEKSSAYVARYYDRNQNLIRLSSGLKVREKEIQTEYLRQLFLQTTTSKEEAVAQLQRDTPIIQILDYPIPPFIVNRASIIRNLILGLILGAIIPFLYFTRRLIREDVVQFIRSSLDETEEIS